MLHFNIKKVSAKVPHNRRTDRLQPIRIANKKSVNGILLVLQPGDVYAPVHRGLECLDNHKVDANVSGPGLSRLIQ